MNLPKEIQDLIAGQAYTVDEAGMSGSDILIFADKVLKIQPETEETRSERAVMRWLKGKISAPEILADVNKRIQGEVILTIEPHLHVFDGLSKLQDEQLKHKESYRTSREAFHAACEAVKNCIGKLEEN